MRIIDLLNKMARNEEVPRHIKYKNYTYTFYPIGYLNDNENIDDDSFFARLSNYSLNAEIEIIGDEYIKVRW